MNLGLSTWSLLRSDLDSAIRTIGDAGYRYVELWGEVPHAYPDWTNKKRLKDTLSAYDLSVSMHAPFVDLNPATPFEPIRSAVARTLKDFVKFGEYLGAIRITIHPGSVHSEALVSQSVQDVIKLMIELVKEGSGLAINIENQVKNESGFHFPLGSTVESLDLLLTQVEGTGLTLDTGHAHVNGADPLALLERFRDSTTEIHLSDNGGLLDDHLKPGDGTAKLQDFMEKVAPTDIFVCLELNPFKYSHDEVMRYAAALRSGLQPVS